MAKDRSKIGDILGGIGTNGAATATAPEPAKRPGVTLELPIGEPEGDRGYQQQLIDGGDVALDQPTTGTHFNFHVGPEAAAAFIRIRNGLRAAGATIPDGRGRGGEVDRPVWSNADALRWILNAIAEQVS